MTELLGVAGIAVQQDPDRGFDHGVFAPLYAAYPDADVPILQLSIKAGYDPDQHLALGRALAPLRDENVLIIGSGLTFHDLRNLGPSGAHASREFDDWLTLTLTESSPAARTQALRDWDRAPSARAAHPMEDHLIPLMVAVGAAEDEAGVRIYNQNDFAGFITASSYRFGAATSA